MVGRDSDEVRLTVTERSDGETPQRVVRRASWPMVTRNFLRPFRGVNKEYLHQYVAIFEWGYVVERATVEFLRALLGVRLPTSCPT